MRRTTHHVVFAMLTGFACVLAPAAANAGQTCTSATDCQKGYDCVVVSATACAGTACAPNTPCPPAPPCTSQETRECRVGATCVADGDCGANMVCHETSSGSCGSAAPCKISADGAADCPPPPDCTTTTTKTCAFKYNLPCSTAADCGDPTLFECADLTVCSVSAGVSGGGTTGSGTTGVGTATATPPTNTSTPAPAPTPTATPTTEPAPVPVPVDAGVLIAPLADAGRVPYTWDAAPVCQPSGVKYCRALPKTCTAAADCPASWTCLQTVSDIACPAIALADGATAPCPAPTNTTSTPGVCAPDGTWAFDTVRGGAITAAAENGGIPPQGSGTYGTPTANTGAGGTTSAGPGAAPTPAPAAPTEAVSGGGCAVASGRTSGMAGLLLALGALVALGRRRRS
jgi:hypothetical protein